MTLLGSTFVALGENLVGFLYVDVNTRSLETLGNIRLWGAVCLSNTINQINLGFCGENWTLGTKQCPSRTTVLLTSNIRLCSLGTTILTITFFVDIEGSMSVTIVRQNDPK